MIVSLSVIDDQCVIKFVFLRFPSDCLFIFVVAQPRCMIFRLCLLYNNNPYEELITSENQGIIKLGNMEESEYKKDS